MIHSLRKSVGITAEALDREPGARSTSAAISSTESAAGVKIVQSPIASDVFKNMPRRSTSSKLKPSLWTAQRMVTALYFLHRLKENVSQQPVAGVTDLLPQT